MNGITLSWIEAAQVVGALQGLLLTGVLFKQKTNRTANRMLAVLMLSFTIYLAAGVYFSTGLVRSFPHFLGLGRLGPWVFGPLVYLYAVAASDRSWRFTRKSWIHFVPLAVQVIGVVPFLLMSGAEKLAVVDAVFAGTYTTRLDVLDPLKYVSGIGYSMATIMFLVRHRREIEHSYSNVERVNLKWLLFLTCAAFSIWVLATALRLSPVSTQLRDEHISLAMAVLVYAIGYLGLRQPEVFRYETAEYPVPTQLLAAPPSPSPDESGDSPRYERSGLGELEARRLKARLMALMDAESPWKESELTLADLATRLDSTPHKLSEVLNSEVGQTFYDFVNGYRVREVQRRIKAGDARALKMLALAMDAGFASKSTFNQAFKKHTSQTPSDFRQAVGA